MSRSAQNQTQQSAPQLLPKANHTLAVGIVFSFAFTALIWALGGYLEGKELLPDLGAAWYEWRLLEPTVWTRFSAWLPYLLHQVVVWGIIYAAQRARPTYSDHLNKYNIWALGANAFFIFLHLLQSHLFYDGLAQDVSVFSSQGSVILLLVMVLLMESPRRGLLFGWRAGVPQTAVDIVKRYHGYVFAWATIYTFWFHPMVATSGHLIGFVYMFLLLLQGSLFFTRAHLNRAWTFTLEVLVLIHGALVAVMSANGLWPMFAFGFASILVATQIYGLGWPRWGRILAIALFIVLVTLVYSGRGWDKLNEVIRIPVIEYLCVFILAGLLMSGHWIWKRMKILLNAMA